MINVDSEPAKSALVRLGAQLATRTTIVKAYLEEGGSQLPTLEIEPSLGLGAYFSPTENTIRLEVGLWVGFYFALKGLRDLQSTLAEKIEQEEQDPLPLLDSDGASRRVSCIRDNLQPQDAGLTTEEFLAELDRLEYMSQSTLPDQRAKWLELDFAVSFIVLHEVAHFALRHNIKGAAEQLSGQSFNDAREITADSFALRLLIKYFLRGIGAHDSIKDCVKIIAIARAVTFAMHVRGAVEASNVIARNCVHPAVHERLLGLTLAVIHGVGAFESFPKFIRGYYGVAAADAAKQWSHTGWPKIEDTAYAQVRREKADIGALYRRVLLLTSDSQAFVSGSAQDASAVAAPQRWYPASPGDFVLVELISRKRGELVVGIIAHRERLLVVYQRDELLNECLDLTAEQLLTVGIFKAIEEVLEGRIAAIVFLQSAPFTWFGSQPALKGWRFRRRLAYRGEDSSVRLSWGSSRFWEQ